MAARRRKQTSAHRNRQRHSHISTNTARARRRTTLSAPRQRPDARHSNATARRKPTNLRRRNERTRARRPPLKTKLMQVLMLPSSMTTPMTGQSLKRTIRAVSRMSQTGKPSRIRASMSHSTKEPSTGSVLLPMALTLPIFA